MFLSHLYHKWRFMFYVVLFFMAGQLFFMYKGVQSIPFFLFFMYAAPSTPSDTSYKTTVFINGQPFKPNMVNREAETLMASLGYYQRLKKNNFLAIEPAAIEKRFAGRLPEGVYHTVLNRLTNPNVNDSLFYNWWGKYLAVVAGKRVDSFSIVVSTVTWKPQYREWMDTASLIKHVVQQ